MARTPEQLNKLISELESKIANLAPNNKGFKEQLRLLQEATKQQGDLNENYLAGEQLLDSVNKEISEINDELGYTFKSFQSIVNEMTKGREATNNITKNVRSLTDNTQKLVNRQTEYGKLSAKELQKIQKQSALNFKNLGLEQERLQKKKQSGDISDKEQAYLDEVNGILKENIGLQDSFTRQINAAVQEQEAVEESLGITGNLLKGIAGLPGLSSISKYLNVSEATEEMENFSQKLIDNVKNSKEFEGKYTRINKVLDAHQQKVGILQEQLEDQNLTVEERKEIEKEIEKRTGSINKAIAARAELDTKATKTATGFAGKLATGLKGMTSLASGFTKALTDPAAIFTFLAKAAGNINSELVDTQKNLNLSYEDAQDMRAEFAGAARSSEDTFINTSKLMKAANALATELGAVGKITSDMAMQTANMTERLGVSSKAAAGFAKATAAAGGSMKENKLAAYETVSAVESQYGVHVNTKQVMEEVGNASAYTLVQFKGSTTALANTVAEAKALGTSMETLNKQAEHLLNFESSIQAEMEAELLTGKELNLERAREAALTNDISTLQEELNSQIGTFSDFQDMNRIQQESYAKALGMSTNELSEQLLMSQYRNKTQEEIAAQEGEEVAKRVEALKTQERFNAAIEKLQGFVADLVAGPLGSMMEIFSNILGSTVGLSAVMGGLVAGPLMKFIKLQKDAAKIAKLGAIFEIFKGNAKFGPVGVALAGAGIAAMLGYAASIGSQEVEDGIAPSGKGPFTITDKFGAMAVTKEGDSLAVSPNIKSGGGQAAAGGSGQTDGLLKELIGVVKTGAKIDIDGQNVGKAMVMGTYNT